MKASKVRQAMDLLNVADCLKEMETMGPLYITDRNGHVIFLDGNDPDDEAMIITIMDLIGKDMESRLAEMDVQPDE